MLLDGVCRLFSCATAQSDAAGSRTVKRVATREELWGTGNRETIANSFFSRNSILYWALKTHRRNRERFARDCADYGVEKRIVRLQSGREVEAFLQAA